MLIVAWCLSTGLLIGLLVFLAQEVRRANLHKEFDALRSTVVVAETRVGDLERVNFALSRKYEEVDKQRQAVSIERERLETQLEEARKQLTTATNSLDEHLGTLGTLEVTSATLSADLRIANAQLESSKSNEIRTRDDLGQRDLQIRKMNEELTQIKADHSALTNETMGLRQRLESQKSWIDEQTKQFEQTVLAAAARVMDERGKAFTEMNKKEVDLVVAPFKEQLAEFRQRVDTIYATDTRERGELSAQILQLTTLNQTTSSETKRLINALTISSKATGDWGETILERILEDSGLRVGKEYQLQHQIKNAEGGRLQPDVVIFLPDARQWVIDAQVSNKAWTAYCAEEDVTRKAERLKDHLASIRAHIRSLSSKDYARSPDLQTVDFVLMFVPVEAALVTALSNDEMLYVDAYRNKIILVTPSTLMAVIKLVEGMWTFQKRKESADKIADAGRKLFEKLTTFANTFVEVGTAIGKARDTFERAQGQLSTGKGNAIGLAQKMVELGISPAPGKAMPIGLLSLDDDSSDEDSGSLAGKPELYRDENAPIGEPEPRPQN